MSQTGDRQDVRTDDEQNVFASEEVGQRYRASVYREVDYESLEGAPATEEFPKTDGGDGFKLADLPAAPKVSHIVGPSAIMLGASLGSGETMFWPSLIAEGGWNLYWAFWVGVLTQFFINTELQRWTMATGESIFRGFERLNGFWPWFFLVTGFFNVGWPGWAASGSEVFAAWTGVVPRADWWIVGAISMVVIWLLYQVGPVMYNIVEKLQIAMMVVAIVFAVALVFLTDAVGQLGGVPAGAVSFGTLPANLDIAVFLGGLAYAGAGGYVNLSQSVWAREKGYGMGTYQGRVKNPLRRIEDPEEVHGGFAFGPDWLNMERWKAWWRITQLEHFLTFVVGLVIVTTIMSAITVQYVPADAPIEPSDEAVGMWLDVVIPQFGGTEQFMAYALVFIALFSTQYAITEVFVRNGTDILYEGFGRDRGWNLNRVFLGLLTVFTLWGILIIVAQFQEPWILLVIGAAIAGVMMWPYNALTIVLNTTRLPEHTQPGWGRVLAMWWATGFFGFFSVLLIGDTAVTYLNLDAFRATLTVVGSGPGGYALWLVFLVTQVYVMYRTTRAKLTARGTVEGADEAAGLLP